VRKVLPQNRFTSVLHRLIDFTTLACGWWLLALSVATCVEILGRKFFGFSLQGVDEIGSYTFASRSSRTSASTPACRSRWITSRWTWSA
jgi:hypothetical protein